MPVVIAKPRPLVGEVHLEDKMGAGHCFILFAQAKLAENRIQHLFARSLTNNFS
jgi:hypothetical protein